jgi:hypothetical protein
MDSLQSAKQISRCFFSAVCGRVDLKFGGDLHIDLHFLFLLYFLLNSSFNSSSSEFEIIHIQSTGRIVTFGRGDVNDKSKPWTLVVLRVPTSQGGPTP